MILADLHVHSTFSDGKLTIPELVDFYGSRRFGCIAITDHICETNSFLGGAAGFLNYTLTAKTFPHYLDMIYEEAERAWITYRMIVIPGFELSKNSIFNHRSAHILGIGVTEFIAPEADAVDLARSIRGQGALAIAAHPVSTRKWEPQTFHLWNRREELANEFDAWEIASGPHLFDEVLKSDLPKVATSDFHRPHQINSWKTVIDAEANQESILAAIRNQDVEFKFYNELPKKDDGFFSWERTPAVLTG